MGHPSVTWVPTLEPGHQMGRQNVDRGWWGGGGSTQLSDLVSPQRDAESFWSIFVNPRGYQHIHLNFIRTIWALFVRCCGCPSPCHPKKQKNTSHWDEAEVYLGGWNKMAPNRATAAHGPLGLSSKQGCPKTGDLSVPLKGQKGRRASTADAPMFRSGGPRGL